MKRIAALFLAGLLLYLCACAPRAPETPPAATAAPTAEPAATALPATPTPAPTAAPVVVTPTPAPRWLRGEETVSYTILTGAAPGAEALTIWLLGEGREILTAFGAEELGEGMFTVNSGLDRSGEDFPAATEETRRVHLAVDHRLADCGLMAALTPVFEKRYGYTVEITAAEGETLAALAREADLAILAPGETALLRGEGIFRSYWAYASTDYYKEGTL